MRRILFSVVAIVLGSVGILIAKPKQIEAQITTCGGLGCFGDYVVCARYYIQQPDRTIKVYTCRSGAEV